MGLEKNLSDALGIDHETPAAPKQEIIPYEPPQIHYDAEEDYLLARKTLRNLIEKGNDAIEEISQIARQQESARGFEVVSTLIRLSVIRPKTYITCLLYTSPSPRD